MFSQVQISLLKESVSMETWNPYKKVKYDFTIRQYIFRLCTNFIAGDNDTGDKFIAGDKNKDAMEVGSCQS